MRKRALALAAAGMALLLCAGPAAAKCGFRNQARVALYGDSGDPNVFVWETRFRLEAYQVGSLDTRTFLMPHARLAPPGTRALVVACVPRVIHAGFEAALDDAVYVRLLGGPFKGQTGWVISSELRSVLGKV